MARTRERRILYVIGSLDHGGAERHLAMITPQLRALGWRPTIYCLSHCGAQADAVRRGGVRVIGPPLQGLRARQLRFTGRLLHLAGAAKLFMLMLFRRPGIAHFFLPGAYVIGAPLAIAARVPVKIMSRRSLNDYQKNWQPGREIEPGLHKHMTAFLGNSKPVVRQLIELEACPKERTHLIYNGIEIAAYGNRAAGRPSREALGLDDAAFVAILVANLIPYKGHADLLHALALIRDELPRPWTVLCVGRDDGLLQELERLARSLGVAEGVRFLGLRTDIPDLLAAANLGLLCSHEEGFSNALLEGMAAGLPMVATDVGGNPEAVCHGETGLVVPSRRDPAALAAAILQLARDPARAKAMGAAGRRRVETRFTLERCVAKYDALYRRLLERH